MPVAPGDHVVFPFSAGAWVDIEEERLLVCRVGELLGVLECRRGAGGAARERLSGPSRRPRNAQRLDQRRQRAPARRSGGTRRPAGWRGSRVARSSRPARGRAGARRASAARSRRPTRANSLKRSAPCRAATMTWSIQRRSRRSAARRTSSGTGSHLRQRDIAQRGSSASSRTSPIVITGWKRTARGPPRGSRRGRRGCARGSPRRSGPAACAASAFCLSPPIGSTRPCSVISPVIPTVCLTARPVSSEASAVTIVTPALGPSLGIAPAGTWMWNSPVLERVFGDAEAPSRGRARRRARSSPTPSSRRPAARSGRGRRS